MMEYDHEPIRGLPGDLPEDEEILWQGSPDWKVLARTAFHTRTVGVYFLLLVLLAFATGSIAGAVATGVAGLAGIGLLALIAWLVARTTVYTLTNKRIVLRIGIALNKCINLPLKLIGAASSADRGAGYGDIALELDDDQRIGYAMLWPHARPWRFSRPQPMLRAVPEVAKVADKLAQATSMLVDIDRVEKERPSRAAAGGLREAHA